MNIINNQRGKTSKTKIQDAFTRLLENRHMDDITIKDICEVAKVNRSTFYAHFDDIYELLEVTANDLTTKLVLRYENLKHAKMSDILFVSSDYLIPYLDFIMENRIFYKTFLEQPYYIRSKMQLLLNNVFIPICNSQGIYDLRKITYMMHYFYSGIHAVALEWINNGCAETSAAIADIIIMCVINNRKDL